MKHLLLTTIAAVLLVGCGESQQSAPAPEAKAVEPVAENSKPEPATVKLEHPQANRVLIEATATGNVEAIKKAIADGADLNATEDRMYGLTPLHLLAGESLRNLERTKKLIKLLIANGANVNALANATYAYKQRTPLDIAQKKVALGLPPVYVDLLRKHGGKTGEELKAEGK